MTVVARVWLPLAIAYAGALTWCVARWNAPSGYFAHCWLVPLVAAVVIWRRRSEWQKVAARPEAGGFLLLGPALVLHAAGALLMIDSWSAASMALAIPGAAWLGVGRARLAGLWPALWLVLLAVPLPLYVEGRLAFTLKEFAVHAGTSLANLLGAGIVRRGDLLVPAGGDGALWVADACSGLRSLLAMTTLAYCLAFFTGAPSPLRRIALLAAATPLAVAANVLRIAALCLLARWIGVPFAEGTGHTMANAAEWIALLLALLAIDRVLSRPRERVVPPAAPAAGRPAGPWAPVLLWLLAGPLAWLSLHRPIAEATGRAELLPAEVAGHVLVPRSDAEEAEFQARLPRWRELLGTSDFVWRTYRDQRGARLHVVALFHDSNWKSVHPPRICIEGSNMDIEIDDLVPAPWLGGGAIVGRIVARSRADGWRYVTLSVFGTRDWASGDYSAFTWHHLPRALLRRSESGFLLRVEAPVRRDEDQAGSERRCAALLRALVPAARELLR